MPVSDAFDQGLSVRDPSDWPTAVSAVPGGGAVYLLTDRGGRSIQLAGTQQLRTALRNRLMERDDEAAAKRAKLEEVASTVWWRRTYSQFETTYRFHLIAREHDPKHYLELCAFSPCWFVAVRPNDTFPRFVAAREIGRDGGTVFGPFPTRIACTRFIEQIEDAFDLCRYHDILVQAPNGEACVYADMGRCDAPCNGSMTLDDYRRLIARAAAAVPNRFATAIDGWTADMKRAAATQAFEVAGRLKQRIADVQKLFNGNAAFVRDMNAFRYLIVQRGVTRSWVRPFFVRPSGIDAGEDVRFKDVEAGLGDWAAALQADAPTPRDPQLAAEQIAIATQFLFKQKRLPGAALHVEQLDDQAAAMAMIRESMAAPPAATAETTGSE